MEKQWSTGLKLRRLEAFKMKILLVEDNVQASNAVKDYFVQKGHEVIQAYNGIKGLEIINDYKFDIIFLDAMMPGMDGFTFGKKVRETLNVPIIMLTALGDEENMLKGYDMGADDYVTKPFSLAVLHAKMLAVLKRKGLTGEDRNILEYGSLKINMSQHIVEVNGEIKKIPRKQYEILMYLIENQGIILTREQILERAWSDEYAVYDRVVDTHIKKLRALLDGEGSRIETVVGVGYMWK